MKVKSESEVTQLCQTPSEPMDCSLTGSSIHGICQARVLCIYICFYMPVPHYLNHCWKDCSFLIDGLGILTKNQFTIKEWVYFCILSSTLLLLLLLSRFSCVQLCVTPEMADHQAPPVPGILQARTLEWIAISFSNA